MRTSQSNPGVARAQVQKALDAEPYVLLGPGYSGSVKVTAPLAAEAGIAQIMGGEAAELTQAGNKFLFRTSFGQQSSMPKVAKYINDELKAKSVAIVWVNNDFGRGGRDVITKEFAKYGIKVAADLSTEAGQADFAADVSKIKAAAPDAVFVYVNEEESARILKELKRQGVTAPLMGETTLVGQKVIELAGDAANGARGHVGLTLQVDKFFMAFVISLVLLLAIFLLVKRGDAGGDISLATLGMLLIPPVFEVHYLVLATFALLAVFSHLVNRIEGWSEAHPLSSITQLFIALFVVWLSLSPPVGGSYFLILLLLLFLSLWMYPHKEEYWNRKMGKMAI